MPLYDPPGFVDDMSAAGREGWDRWMSTHFSRAVSGRPDINDGPRRQFFAPAEAPADVELEPATVSWGAFPNRIQVGAGEPDRWEQADSYRQEQDEYCEWSVQRDGKAITSVVFTCEGREYWQELWAADREKVLTLYRRYVDPAARPEDLVTVDQAGRQVYNPWNDLNTRTEGGLMHLVCDPNSLWAEIYLAGGGSMVRRRDGRIVTDRDELIECGKYGEPTRNSDPSIGAAVNFYARKGARVTLQQPVGLYFDDLAVTADTWSTPDGANAKDFWTYERGAEGHRVRARFEVPPERGYTVSDITIDDRPIQWGAQIADKITIKLTGMVSARPDAADVVVVDGCVPDALSAAAASESRWESTRFG